MTARRPRTPLGALALALVTAAAGCGPGLERPLAPAPAPAGSAAPGEARSGWEGAPLGKFHSLRFGLWVLLPDGPAWRIDDHRGGYFVATHAPSASTLRIKLLRTDEPINRARCEQRAREGDPSLPIEEAGRVVESRSEDVLPGWDAHAFAVVAAKKGSPVLEARYVVFAARVRRCLVIDYGTQQSGDDPRGVIGARLGDMSELVRRIQFEDERSAPERAPMPDL